MVGPEAPGIPFKQADRLKRAAPGTGSRKKAHGYLKRMVLNSWAHCHSEHRDVGSVNGVSGGMRGGWGWELGGVDVRKDW